MSTTDNIKVDCTPKNEKEETEFDISINKLLQLIKNLIINPIISEETVESRIKQFSYDLGEILLFLYLLALKIKDRVIKTIKQTNNEKDS